MQKIIDFWRKDLINKMILLISLVLCLSLLLFIVMVLRMPKDSLFFTALFPKSNNGLPTLGAQFTETPVPTITMMIWPSATPQNPTTTPTPFPSPSPSPTTIPPTSTATPQPATALPASPTITLATNFAADCIPQSEPQVGTVVDIVDGYTIKVLIKEDVYTVRYLGIQVPKTGELYAPEAAYQNGLLVFAKEVRLFKDVTDTDNMGRLLRFVMQGETFVNFEMVRTGYATALDAPPDSACAQAFTTAEQTARQSSLGQWKYVPTPTP